MDSIFRYDFHVHSYHSPCAKDKDGAHPFNLLQRAAAMGIETIAFSDHFAQFPPYALPEYAHCGPPMIAALRQEIERVSTDVRVLFSCEVDVIAPGTICIDAAYAAQLDFVMAACSHFHLPGVVDPASDDPRTIAEHYLAFLDDALDVPFVAVIAHPFHTPHMPYGVPETYMQTIQDEELYRLAEKARHNRVAFDVNDHLGRYPELAAATKRFYNICQEVGCRFIHGSDAHHYDQLGPSASMENAIRALGLRVEHFLDADELLTRDW